MLKKIFLYGMVSLSSGLLHAQTIDDLSRYSNLQLTGTSRSMGMGGAVSALGPDMSAMSINPAGIGMYRSNQMQGTLGIVNMSNNANYLFKDKGENKFNFQIPQMGLVFANENGYNKKSGLIFYNFGFGFNQRNDFNRRIGLEGINSRSSYLDRIAEYAQLYNMDPDLVNYQNLQSTEEAAFLTNTIVQTGANTFEANLPADAVMKQTTEIQSSGRMNDWNLSGAINISHKFYAGLSLGMTTIRYKNKTTITEEQQNTTQPVSFENVYEYFTKGSGVNLKAGVIYRPVDFIRLSAAYHSPTTFNLTEEYNETFRSAGFDETNYSGTSGVTWGLTPFLSRYKISTPSRLVFGTALIYKKLGMLTFDYEVLDYTQGRMSGFDGVTSLNNAVPTVLTSSGKNLRVGAEMNYRDLRFRAGYANIGSPYNLASNNIKQSRNYYTFGFGFVSEDDWFLDIATVISSCEDTYTPYYLEITPRDYYTAKNNFNMVNIMFSVGAKF